MALADGGDKDVIKSVVVIIADRHTHAIDIQAQAGSRGNVGKCCVAIVVVEPKSIAAGGFMSGPAFAVDEQDVSIAVVVVVNKGAARTQGFRQVFLTEGTIVVDKTNAGGLGDVSELKSMRIRDPRARNVRLVGRLFRIPPCLRKEGNRRKHNGNAHKTMGR